MLDLTVSKLIAILQSIQDSMGDMPVCVWDADTGWQIPIARIIQTGDNAIMVECVLKKDDRIHEPMHPLLVHWRGYSVPTSPPPAATE